MKSKRNRRQRRKQERIIRQIVRGIRAIPQAMKEIEIGFAELGASILRTPQAADDSWQTLLNGLDAMLAEMQKRKAK